MIDANKRMNPQHFGTDPLDIRTQIQINQILAMAEMCALWAQSSCFCALLFSLTQITLLEIPKSSYHYSSYISSVEIVRF